MLPGSCQAKDQPASAIPRPSMAPAPGARSCRPSLASDRCPRVAIRLEDTAVGVPVMGGESPAGEVQSAVWFEEDARNDADHAFAKMSTGIPHLPWRDEDAHAVPLGAFGR